MQKIAIIGFGNHVKKNILPALSRMDEVEVDAVYVRDPSKYTEDANTHGCVLCSIDDRPADEVEWVYIATPIASHYDLAHRHLTSGKNVICEKPVTPSYGQTRELLDLAESKGLAFYEVCMYQYHKQFAHLKNLIEAQKQSVRSVSVTFSIPHLNSDNIRYSQAQAGGALLDVGYYPISLITSLFGEPDRVHVEKFGHPDYEVDLRGVATFVYGSVYCLAEWGIGMPYRNEATVFTETEAHQYKRIFSKPSTFASEVIISGQAEAITEVIGPDDHFVNMFRSFFTGSDPCEGIQKKGNDLNTLKVISRFYSEPIC